MMYSDLLAVVSRGRDGLRPPRCCRLQVPKFRRAEGLSVLLS